MLSPNYFNDDTNFNILKELILDKNVSMKDIQKKYNFSKQRLYQIITQYNLPTKYKTRRNKFKEQYGNNSTMYKLKHALEERKSYYILKTGSKEIQDASIDDLLLEGCLPIICPVFNVKLDYTSLGTRKDNTVSIDKVDNSKGYIKGNVALISWKANKIKNEGTIKEHEQIIQYMKNSLQT